MPFIKFCLNLCEIYVGKICVTVTNYVNTLKTLIVHCRISNYLLRQMDNLNFNDLFNYSEIDAT